MGRIADALKKADQQRGANPRASAAGRFDADAPPSSWGGLRDGVIPVIPTKRPVATVVETTVQRWDVDPALVSVRDKTCSTVEQYRAVRTWLLRRAGSAGRSCLAVTSSLPREGKSVTTANLAVTCAELKHLQVLAIDADFRQGALAGLYRINETPGLAEVLTGKVKLDEAIARTPLGNLSVLPAGSMNGLQPSELLGSTTASRVFDEIRERFHFVLVDTPPVQRLSDVGVIAGHCSGVLMVVRMHKTPAHLVRQSVGWLQSNHLPIVGCIAAGCNLSASRYDDHCIAETAA
jgi:capsular exopolysaccharide synthesis family protein